MIEHLYRLLCDGCLAVGETVGVSGQVRRAAHSNGIRRVVIGALEITRDDGTTYHLVRRRDLCTRCRTGARLEAIRAASLAATERSVREYGSTVRWV